MVTKMCYSLILVILLFSFPQTYTRKLPSYITKCALTDPGLNQCIVDNMKKCLSKHEKGLPELNIPPLDPLQIPLIEMEQGRGTTLTFKAAFKNLIFVGIKDVIIHSVNFDSKDVNFDIHVTFPLVKIDAEYQSEGRLLLIPFLGKGKYNGTFYNLDTKLFMKGKYVTNDGKKHVLFDEDKVVKLKIEDAHMYFDRLFGDNEELNVNTNKLINENVKDIIEEVKPILEEATGGVIYGLIRRLFNHFTFDELFITQ